MFDADGTIKNGKSKSKRFVYTTNSPKLASQVSSILHSVGIKCSINQQIRNTNKSKNKIIYRVVGYGKKNVDLHNQVLNNFDSITTNPYEYTVTNVRLYEYNGEVFNCEVANDHSYVCYPGFVAHNCCNFSGWQRTTKGLPTLVVGDTPGLSEPAKTVEELVSYYRDSTIFLNTSTVSPVPTALLEAMACGCAVVSTATCMIPEVITDGHDGFISNDEGVLRSKLEFLLNNPSECRRLGYNARQTILKRFNKETFISKWNSIFDEAANIIYTGGING